MVKKLLLTITLVFATYFGTGVAFANCLTYPKFLENNKDITEQTFSLKQEKLNELVLKLSVKIEGMKLGKLKDGKLGLLIVGSGGCILPRSIISGSPDAMLVILNQMGISIEDFVKEQDA